MNTLLGFPEGSVATDPCLRKGDLSLTFFSMVTTLGTPRDVTLQQLEVECFFPADAATEQVARRNRQRRSISREWIEPKR